MLNKGHFFVIRAPSGNTQFEYISTVNRQCCFILPHVTMLFSHKSNLIFMTALYEKREIVCNEKSDVYVTHRNGLARKRAYSQVNVLFKCSENKTV